MPSSRPLKEEISLGGKGVGSSACLFSPVHPGLEGAEFILSIPLLFAEKILSCSTNGVQEFAEQG